MTATQNLERHYDLFANATSSWEFFSGLANYSSYVLKTPELRRIVGREMQKRNAMLRKRGRYENRAIQELNEVKEKLLSVIEINKIDVRGFDQASSWKPNPRGKDETILTDLKFFEEGKISISGNYSDNLEHYIFDIAANLLRLGYEKEIKDFIVSNEQYAGYYARINGNEGSGLVLDGNIHGAFIFSKTWPSRFEQDRAIERARNLEPWGAFEALIKLHKAREAVLDDKNLRGILVDAFHDTDYVFDTHDAVNIVYAAEDIKALMKNSYADERELGYLKISRFRPLSATVHSYMLQNFISEPDRIRSVAMTQALKRKREELERAILNKAVQRMDQFMDKYEPMMEGMEAFMKEHEPEKYKKAEEEKAEKLERITREVEEIRREKNESGNIMKIAIVSVPELPVRLVGDNTPAKGKKRASAMELSIQEPVQWEKVTFKIKEGRREVEIFYDYSHIITADYIQLSFFVGKKQQKPDRQWGFLCALSTLSATDIKEATAENMRRMITGNKTLSINNVQQVKKSVVERLKEIFKTADDPFRDERDYYHPKFIILPEPSLRQEEVRPQGGRLGENRDNWDDEGEAL
jgi:hypothetical protein